MAPAEPLLPVELSPEHARTSLSISEHGEEVDLGASEASLARSTRSTQSKSSRTTGWRSRIGLGGVARRTLGIALLLVTVFLWTTSNFLASYIFSDHSYDKPFFVVYINTSLFAISLVPMFIQFVVRHGLEGVRSAARQVWHEQRYGSSSARFKPVSTSEGSAEDSPEEDSEQLLVDDEGSLEALDGARPGASVEGRLSLRETAVLSLEFCMLWFFANYFASACLEYTSVGSVTILTSTSSVWTLIFCAVMRVEGFTIRKLVGVTASLVGIVLISTVDLSGQSDENRGDFPHKSRAQIAIGDAMAFVSAVIYGLYVTVMKRRVGNEDRVNMPLFFGLVGLFNLVILWPGFFILHWTGVEPFEWPPTGKIWAIIIANSLSSFISDMSWAYAMLLTTPLVVTVGLSLTIPLSLIGEMIQYHQYSSIIYWIGAAIVFVSFLFINHESQEEDGADGDKANEASARV